MDHLHVCVMQQKCFLFRSWELCGAVISPQMFREKAVSGRSEWRWFCHWQRWQMCLNSRMALIFLQWPRSNLQNV